MFLLAARRLAAMVDKDDLEAGMVFPPLSRILSDSLENAVAVAVLAWDEGLAQAEYPDDVERMIREQMYEPDYQGSERVCR